MPITALDIRYRKSERLTDNPDGGGRMVQAEIIDGQLNNLFPDIGDEERTTGRSTLRKMFVHVDTDDTDVLKDAIAVIIRPPGDSNVHVSMFATGSYSDERAAARNRVEAYITKGVESRFILLGDHFIGQQAISMYCMPDAPTPDVGDNLALVTTTNEQYIRVRSILNRSTQTFVDTQGAFERDVVIIESENALLYDFGGQEAYRQSNIKPATRIHVTNNIDAATYFSVKKLTEAAETGALTVNVGSPYVPIVPSTTAETPLVDQLAGLGTVAYPAAGASSLLAHSYSSAFAAGVGVTRFLGSPISRGTTSVTVGATTLEDDGSGRLVAAGVSPWSGSIDYGAGSVTVSHELGIGSTAVAISATPGAPLVDQGYTRGTHITPVTQGYNYVFSLLPLPAPGTTSVDYRALGRWIRLQDNGKGQLVGNPGQGSGTVNYATGSVVVTLGALPDLDSHLLTSWGTGVTTERRDGDTNILPPFLNFMLEDGGISPGTFELTAIVAASPVVVTDDGAGVLELGGNPVGYIVYATGEVGLRLPTLPDAATTLAVEYEFSAVVNNSFNPTADGGGIVNVTLASAPVRAGTVELTWQVSVILSSVVGSPLAITLRARDDGAGALYLIDRPDVPGSIGTINYSTGEVSVKVGGHRLTGYRGEFLWSAGSYLPTSFDNLLTDTSFGPASLLSAAYQTAASGETAADDEYTLPPVKLHLTPGTINPVLPGSVRFVFRGRTYVDRNGSLYYGIDPATGAGTYAGTIDYSAGMATIAQWQAGGSNAVTIQALLVRSFDPGVGQLKFRTPGAPLRPGAFTLRATALDGVQYTATSDVNGVLTGAQIAGEVDWQTGVVDVRFGQYVTSAGNEGEDWYDAGNVVGPNVWKPMLMSAGAIFANMVVYRSIPMSSVVVGLDPVRLPPNGLVPCYKPGQTVLVHHTSEQTLTPSAGATTDLGRERIAQVEVLDAEGTPVLSTWWTADLDAGEIEWSDPLNLSAYEMPITLRNRIEDRRLVAEVQINGDIALNSGLSHDFPDDALVSTALRLGEPNGSLDLQARVQSLFDISTWNANIWNDGLAPGQSAAPATFNGTDYPILVTNADAITERWALVFTNATNFNIVGETVGVIGTGSTASDVAPINPRTTEPYFTIDRDGFGLGWATNNAIRFNTIGGLAPVWCVRTTIAGTPEQMIDSYRMQVIGNIAGETP